MKVALVNTNRFLYPPTIPIGLEYLLAPLEKHGHETVACDLAFSEDPGLELTSFLDDFRPGAVGFSIRNLDTVHFDDNIFFLDDVARLVELAKEQSGAPAVIGGAATLCGPEALLEYVGADHVIAGPAEKAFLHLLEAIEAGEDLPAVTDGWSFGTFPGLSHPRARLFDYPRYLKGGGIAGLEFRKGCNWDCPYCLERSRPLLARDVEAVVREAGYLAGAGVEDVFICDSEVNQDTDGTRAFLSGLAESDLGLKWTGYFRPRPFDRETARLASCSGCDNLTLMVNSWDISGGGGPYGREEVSGFIELCRDEGIKVVVDLLVGYPGEGLDSVEAAIDFMAGTGCSSVGIVHHLRLYEGLPSTSDALERRDGLLGRVSDNPGMLMPAYYSSVDREWLLARVEGNPLFVIEGTGRTINYQRV